MQGSRQALPDGLTHLGLSIQAGVFHRRYLEDEVVESKGSLEAYFVNLSLRHYLGNGVSVDLLLPTGLIRFKQHEKDLAHYISGFGDIEVGARYDFAGIWGAGGHRPSVALRLALGLPTGTQDEVTGTPGVTPNQVLSIGRAALSVSPSLEATQFLHRRVALVASAGTNIPLSTTPGGIRFAPTVHYGLGVLWVPVPSVTLVGKLTGNHMGQTHRQDGSVLPNSGGDWLSVEMSVGWRINRRWSVGAGARVPFFAHVNGLQLSETVSVLSTVGLSFGGASKKAAPKHEDHQRRNRDEGKDCDETDGEHGHQHGHKPDVKDSARGGQTFDLKQVLVSGKVTVVDFWATWCNPCKNIDAALHQLARHHEQLAVRRVQVTTFETPVAEDHLKGVDRLPVVWIYDRRGQRAYELVNPSVSVLRQRVSEILGKQAPSQQETPTSQPTSQPTSKPCTCCPKNEKR